MANKSKSKWFVVATEGATTDGRKINREWLSQIAKNYDPKNTYGARVNLEHFRWRYFDKNDAHAYSYGDVLAVKTEEREDGKLQLLAQIEPTDALVALVKDKQKVYTSIEIDLDFSDTGEAYLVGLAVTDTPASLGTEYLTFCAGAQHNPLNDRKQKAENLVSEAVEATLEFTEECKTTDIAKLVKQTYLCQQVNFDTHVRYAQLDAWAKFPDFQKRLANVAVKQRQRDLLMVGFNGTSRAATSDRNSNPLLQDVAKGWLQKIRDNASERVMNGESTGNQVLVGKGQEYANLDALVMDATEELIAEWHRDDTELVAIVGRKLLADKYFPIVNKDNAPTEQLAADLVISQKRIGGLKAVRASFFPANAILITKLENLAIYIQEGATRKLTENNPKKDRIETYESDNIDYIVEDHECAALIENITLKDKEE